MIIKSKAIYFFMGLALFLGLVIFANIIQLQNGETLTFLLVELGEYSFISPIYLSILLFLSGIRIRSYILTDDDLIKAQQIFQKVNEN